MAQAAKKIIFSRSRDIPFNKLVLSEQNVRQIEPEIHVDDLTQDIDRREDLIQGLNVRAIVDKDGAETGMFEVPAGGRRFRAIERLVKAKRFPRNGLVPCIVRKADTKVLPEDDSLAENINRVALHPLDQFRAFKRMFEQGMTKEEIAAAFFTTVQFVSQRLRLFAASRPLAGTLAESVLRGRGLADLRQTGSLRFHPRCFYRPDPGQPSERWPALIAAVTDLDEKITGVHRTWLDPGGFDPARLGKAPFERPRRGLGDLLGNAVRFGKAADVLAAGEGIETVLSVRQVLPGMPMAAALSADHLAAMAFPPALRRLYILRDADAAGDRARDILFSRAREAGIETVALSPRLEDFNEDLRRQGPRALLAGVLAQLVPEDTERWRLSR